MAEIFRDTPVSMALGIEDATEVTATIVQSGVDLQTFTGPTFALPFKVYGYDGPFDIRWEFFVDDDPTLHTRYERHEVVTPLVAVDPEDPEAVQAERVVRKIIEAVCGQSFGFHYHSHVVYGQGGNSINLPERLIRLDGVSSLQAPYEAIPFGAVNIIADGWMLTTNAGRQFYSIKQMPPEESYVSANGAIIAPGSVRAWRNNHTYLITGSWGYSGVPTEVSDAARMLIDDYNCDEDAYRNKYMANMRSADWRIEFNALTWQGTGNAKVDALLSPYIKSGTGVF
jgi:hypothetical protein